MKKYLVIGLLVLILASAIGIRWAQSTVSITAPDGYAVTCASIYTRFVPHFCKLNSFSMTALTLDNTCRSVDLVALYSIPLGITHPLIAIKSTIVSGNAIGERGFSLLRFWNDAACTTPLASPIAYQALVREEVAAVGVNLIQLPFVRADGEMSASTGLMHYKGTTTACSGCSVNMAVIGYHD